MPKKDDAGIAAMRAGAGASWGVEKPVNETTKAEGVPGEASEKASEKASEVASDPGRAFAGTLGRTARRPAGEAAAEACIQAGEGDVWLNHRTRIEHMLKPTRFVHSLHVADASVTMGRIFGGDLVKLAIAGLLHDGAKELSDERYLALGGVFGLITDPAERATPSLLHGPVAAWLAKCDWGVDDPIILQSIRLHTTGGPEMSKEACIVFMADLIEPGRKYRGVKVLRQLCREDLRAAMIEAVAQTLVLIARDKRPLHSGMLRCQEWLYDGRGTAWKTWKARN
ncbi:MAG: bis(5'-nucleosyl)-tetraphosphatase (symmetrical) YqeK [Clostridiales bacterium]|nr:bis(5'-nucleosyl)-tetraphosphatase (symmetrical) YqeK [Clostridiales bacterium]